MNKTLNKLALGATLSLLTLTANASSNLATSLQAPSLLTAQKTYNGFYGYTRAQAEQQFLAWANGRDSSYYCRTTYPGEMGLAKWLCTGYVV